MWLKADLHTHTSEGVEGFVRWSPRELIDQAARAGYQVLSVTDHDRVTHNSSLARYARDRGILLIPGLEATVEGRHVLLYNFPCPSESLRTFAGIRRHKGPQSLVVAPHPFFPGPTSLGHRLLAHLDLFDAIEYSHFYTRWMNHNRGAVHLAQRRGLPLVGCSDAHLPRQFGTTYSLVEAEPDPEEVLGAIRRGRVKLVSRPLSAGSLCAIAFSLLRGAMLAEGERHLEPLRAGLRWMTAALLQGLTRISPARNLTSPVIASRRPDRSIPPARRPK
jgi:predicted metal-dependent phosphoesterase TrpH